MFPRFRGGAGRGTTYVAADSGRVAIKAAEGFRSDIRLSINLERASRLEIR